MTGDLSHLTPIQASLLPLTGWLQGDGEEEPVFGPPWIAPNPDHDDGAEWVWFWSRPPERGQEDVRELHGILLRTLRRGGRIPDPVETRGGPS